MVRDRPFFASLFDGFDRRTLCDGGGTGGGSSNTECRTVGGDTRWRTWIVPPTHDAAARTTVRKAERHGDERLADVAGRFEGDVGKAGEISWLDLRFAWPSGRTELNETISEELKGNSTVGDNVGSMESSAGLAMSLRSIPTGGGVGGRGMMQWFG